MCKEICTRVENTHVLIQREFLEKLVELDLSKSEMRVLLGGVLPKLTSVDFHPLKSKELADAFDIDLSIVSKGIKRLKKRGIIISEEDELEINKDGDPPRKNYYKIVSK